MDLLDVFNHLVLPAILPGCKDGHIDLVSNDIFNRLIDANKVFIALRGLPFIDSLQTLMNTLERSRILSNNNIDKAIILAQFRELKPSDSLIIHVVEQNAAIIIRREL